MSFSMFTKLLTTSLSVQGSGYNLEGQLDNWTKANAYDVNNLSIQRINSLDKSVYHTIYIMKDGTVKGTGYNGYGQLGLGDYENRYEPTDINITDVKQVSCGGYHTIFLRSNGRAYATGHNDYGQLGLGHNTMKNSILEIPNLKNIEKVVGGGYHTFFLLKNGSVYACGYNSFGQLGLGNNTDVNTPTKVNITNVKEIYCGGYYTFFLKNDGTVYACGYNGYGELGLGNNDDVNIPTKVDIDNIKKIECSAHHTLFLKNDGTVYGCGQNSDGQLGLKNWDDQNSIVQLPIENVTNITTDGYTSIFMKDSRHIYGCGHNTYGELGLGDNINRNYISLLNYSNIISEDYSDDIIILPPFDENKKLYVADGYFISYNKSFLMLLDKDLVFKVYNRRTMEIINEIYLYIYRGELHIETDKSLVFNSDGTKKYPIEPFTATGDSYEYFGNYFHFGINNILLRYDCSTGKLIKAFINKEESSTSETNGLCKSVCKNTIVFEDKVVRYDNGNYIVKSRHILSNCDGVIYCNMKDNNKKVFNYFAWKGNTIYLTEENLNKVYNKEISDTVTTALYTVSGTLFIGTKRGYLYSFSHPDYLTKPTLYKKFDHGISCLKLKENNNILDKTLLIDDHGSYLVIGFDDGGYIKHPLYPMPEIEFNCNDVNFIGNKVYYHINLRLKNENVFYDNMQFLIHDKYNDETIKLGELDEKGKLYKTVSFTNKNTGLFTYLRLNYVFGNNSLGTMYTQVCNTKVNMIYSYLDKIFMNVSNYSDNDCDIVLEKVDINTGNKEELDRVTIKTNSNNKFFYFKEIKDLEYINIKAVQFDDEIYLYKELEVSNITLDNSIKNINADGDILLDFDYLFNGIYENINLKDIPLERLVNILNQLSHKKNSRTDRLEDLKLNPEVKNDIYGNEPMILQNNSNHYLMTFHPDYVYKDVRFRSNIFINGRKVPYRDVFNIVNTNESSFNTYFISDEVTKGYVEGNIYEESLISSEKELYLVKIKTLEDVDKLLKGEYYIHINVSEYIDVNNISLYVKFRYGTYTTRINLNSYDLIIKEINKSYIKLKLRIRDQVLCQVGNVIHLTLNDLDKNTNIIFKDTSKSSNKYKNYFVPLLSLSDYGSIINYYITKSEHIEVYVNGYTLIPYVDYKVMNFPLHLQLPSIVLFKNPIKNDVKIEISILKEDFIDGIIKKKNSDKYIINSLDDNVATNYIPLLYNTYDKFIDNIKVPNLYEDGKTSEVYSDKYYDRKYEYIRFYLENNQIIRFLITMLKIKLKNEDIKSIPNNIGTVTKETFNPEKITHYNLYEDDSTEGLLFFLFEVFDNDIINNENIVIDCNDDDQIKMDTNVKLDENIYFKLPYITEDIKLDSNSDYDKNNYNNSIK